MRTMQTTEIETMHPLTHIPQ